MIPVLDKAAAEPHAKEHLAEIRRLRQRLADAQARERKRAERLGLWDEFRDAHFGTPYEIWHDGIDVAFNRCFTVTMTNLAFNRNKSCSITKQQKAFEKQ